MNLIKELKEIKSVLGAQILFNEKLSNYSWFNLGGPAKAMFKPKNLIELSTFLKKIKGFTKIKVLGVGSNTLIRDGGFDGIIIKLSKSFSHLSLINKNMLIAGSSALDKNVSNFAFENSISGFEFLSCIPGTVGGALRMNSGCYEHDVAKILKSVQVMDLSGNVRVIYSPDIKFSYRNCDLDNNFIFISATFEGKYEEKKNIRKYMNTLINKKKNDQPSKIKTCGSTFKNPRNNKAWKLIKDAGCSKMKVGGAFVSEKHCNFFINKGNAKSQDFEDLIKQVKTKVLSKTGIKLELELKVIGERI